MRRLVLAAALVLMSVLADAAAAQDLVRGQTLYVPCYSHVYQGIKTRPFLLTVTLSLRNIDPKNKVTVTAVDYLDTDGALVRRFLSAPVIIPPMGTREYIVEESDKSGGSGANFVVRWRADVPVNPLLSESVMIGTYSNQGISFTSRGVAITE